MSFLSLYRKYRPEKFGDLVGQQHIVRTLTNALKYDRITHAYLFAGPRGTGKTSTAKVYAMALNCRDDSSVEPCGTCRPCQHIRDGQSMDVIEIDAASNRGIDEIRELREKVKFYPGEGDYKVYIIDEVHMLTKGAFNALLKTLEEPPENVVFILATTEPHKVIETILSRCQRFDFSLLGAGDIQERLEYICKNEGIDFTSEAVNLIARSSNGGLRDAISLLDQAVSYSGGRIESEPVQTMLGKADIGVIGEFLGYLNNSDVSSALTLLNELIEKGKGIGRLVEDLIEHCRQLLVCKHCGGKSGIIEYPRERLAELERESEQFTAEKLKNIINIMTGMAKDIKYSNRPRHIMELGIVKMASAGEQSEIDSLKKRINRLEERLEKLTAEGSKRTGDSEAAPGAIGASERKETVEPDNKDGEKKPEQAGKSSKKPAAGKVTKEETTAAEAEVSREETAAGEAEVSERKSTAAPEVGVSEGESTAITAAEDTQKNDREEQDLSIDLVRKKWPGILSGVKKKDIKTHAFLVEGKPAAVKNNMVIVEFSEQMDFHKRGAERNSDLINKVINKELAASCRIKFRVEGEGGTKKKAAKKQQDTGYREREVARIAKMFDGDIIKVEQKILAEQEGCKNEYE